jgi:hypothetical protein
MLWTSGREIPESAALHLDEDFAFLGLRDRYIVFENDFGVLAGVLYERCCLGCGYVCHVGFCLVGDGMGGRYEIETVRRCSYEVCPRSIMVAEAITILC